ncbi:MAG: exopolysaccharide biosynthesis protein [Kiloniellales bacterium]
MSKGSIKEIVDKLDEAAEEDEVTVGKIIQQFGNRTYGPLLFVIGLVSLSPLGSIPGASIFFASLTILLMAQYLFRSGPPWIPGWIERASVDSERFSNGLDKVKPALGKVRNLVRERITQLSQPPWSYGLAIIAILLALIMYPLALIPWGVAPPSLALCMIELGIVTRDGVLLIIGWLGAIAAMAAAVWLLI